MRTQEAIFSMLLLTILARMTGAAPDDRVPLGAWVQPDANGPAFCITKVSGAGHGDPIPSESISFNIILRNPTPKIYQWFNSNSIQWKVLETAGHNIAGSQTMVFAANGESDQSYRLYPGQRLMLTYIVKVLDKTTPTMLVADFGGVTSHFALTSGQLGKEIAPRPFPRQGAEQLPGTDAVQGKWYPFQHQQTDLEFLISRVDGLQPLPAKGAGSSGKGIPEEEEPVQATRQGSPRLITGTRHVRVHLSVKNVSGKPWRYFNRSTIDVALIDANEQTVSHGFAMLEPNGKQAGSYMFDPGERRDFVYDIVTAAGKSGAPIVKVFATRESSALRFRCSAGNDTVN